ncbi:uncharacterized protein si:ch211-149e23.4 [Poeciliopsis prolifica]|uniref:uncharacterized protein si:ch211-149e23.4 n=1 Tax=Poeciliopsis prolifica TaxID=188132 RepID=UPI0024132461|nr:uncharacterized protein si:ch211-149e23.4 [Poeciliopsis prolifica]
MGCSLLLILALVQNVAHSLEIQGSGEEPATVIAHNATGVLGEDVYLRCEYLGAGQIQKAEWKLKLNSQNKFRRLVRFSQPNQKPFTREDFSEPASLKNLTVRMRVSSVEAEGEYMCEFENEEENSFSIIFVTVLAKPEVQTAVSSETINGTHYQSVSCSAVGGRPTPRIDWLVGGRPPSGFPFTVTEREAAHLNGTSTLSSVLRFPTRLQDEQSVTCVVRHETLPKPERSSVRVETYVRPNVTIKEEMVQEGGNDFWVVSCVSSGGRPDADISLALDGSEEVRRESGERSEGRSLSVRLPVAEHEGRNVTCVFKHPKFSHPEARAVTLPTLYLSGVQLRSDLRSSSGEDLKEAEFLELHEGDGGVIISLEVAGNVPRYTVICKKDDGPLPEDVELVGRNLTIQGVVKHQHAGLYECNCSYLHLKATLQFNLTVKALPPLLVSPTIKVDSRSGGGFRMIECAAADAVPAASVSWILPEADSEDFWSNSTFYNGTHSVLLLPACLPQELTALCVINHPAFKEAQNRSVTLPLCARPNITVSLSSEWESGQKYSKMNCSVVSVASAAAVAWHTGDKNDNISHSTKSEFQAEGLVSTWSSVFFLTSLYAGQNFTCTVKHASLESPEERTIRIPLQKPPRLSASVVRQQDSLHWLAVCNCKGDCVDSNLAWTLPTKATGETIRHTRHKGHIKVTYQFPLVLHEGHNLTCVYQSDNGVTQYTTLRIPKYHISSVKVLNNTNTLKSRYADQPVVYRVSAYENRPNQKVLLGVEGNVPDYSLDCRRSDGSIVQLDGAAVILQSGQNKGLYICFASFYHHTASVSFQVEVLRESEQFVPVVLICISSASAILIVFTVILCVCCKRKKTPYKERESVSALTSLMHEPGSPEVRKPLAGMDGSKEYAQLTSFAIVFDAKSTV